MLHFYFIVSNHIPNSTYGNTDGYVELSYVFIISLPNIKKVVKASTNAPACPPRIHSNGAPHFWDRLSASLIMKCTTVSQSCRQFPMLPLMGSPSKLRNSDDCVCGISV